MGKRIPFDSSTIDEKLSTIKREVESGTSMPLAVRKAGLGRGSSLFKTISQDPRYLEISAIAEKKRAETCRGIKSIRYRRLSDEEIAEIYKQCRRTGIASIMRKWK